MIKEVGQGGNFIAEHKPEPSDSELDRALSEITRSAFNSVESVV